VARTIRTCSLIALTLAAAPVEARRTSDSALSSYARGRAADRANDSATAVASYNAALTTATDATMVAFRAYRAGLDGGDYVLAVRAAQVLERIGIVPADARVLLYLATLKAADWTSAKVQLGALERDDGLSFLAPLFRNWLSLATGEQAPPESKPTAYGAENQALLALAQGNVANGSAAIRTLWLTDRYRSSTLQLAAAATLHARRQSSQALTLVAAGDPAAVAARTLIQQGKRMTNSVDTPARGAAFVLQRVAADLLNERSPRSAVTMARLAVYADPASPQAQLVLATALGNAKRPNEALDILAVVLRDPVYADTAAALRVDQLEAAGRVDDAMAEAGTRASRSHNDLARLGDLEARRGRFAEAAVHYRAAVDAIGEAKVGASLWLALGNALEQAGDWRRAKPALERALALDPANPRLLNQLGFGMAERGEDLPRALSLIGKADAAQPDNPAIIDSLGWAQLRAGRTAQAVATLERARKLDPGESEIAEHLGDAYWTAGRRIEARYAWVAARETAVADRAEKLALKIERGLP